MVTFDATRSTSRSARGAGTTQHLAALEHDVTALFATVPFAELIGRYVIKPESEKLYTNTSNDYGLEGYFMYLGGAFNAENKWTNVYGWPPEGNSYIEQIPYARVNNLKFRRARDGTVTAKATYDSAPSGYLVAAAVTDIPDELLPFIHD